MLNADDFQKKLGEKINSELNKNSIEQLKMEIKDLKRSNRILEKRLRYLLRSKIVQLYDEMVPFSNEHQYSIQYLDNTFLNYSIRKFLRRRR